MITLPRDFLILTAIIIIFKFLWDWRKDSRAEKRERALIAESLKQMCYGQTKVVRKKKNLMTVSDNVKMTKVTVNLPEDLITKLDGYAKFRGLTTTTAIRDAIQTYLFFRERIDVGERVLLEQQNKKIRLIEFL